MSQVILASGERVIVKESVKEVMSRVYNSDHEKGFIELTNLVWMSPCSENKEDYMQGEIIVINSKHIVSFY